MIVLEALSQEFKAGVPWEELYANDPVIIVESLKECIETTDMAKCHGRRGSQGQCRQDKDHDL